MLNKKGQVWIETVIYTLIGLAIIGIVLAVITPQINKYKDKAVLDQTVDVLKYISGQIGEVKYTAGNSREVEIRIKKGQMKIDGENNEIRFEMESTKVYSEPGKVIKLGEVEVLTEENEKIDVTLRLNYSLSNLNITYKGEDKTFTMNPAPNSYLLTVRNAGNDDSGDIIIDFR